MSFDPNNNFAPQYNTPAGQFFQGSDDDDGAMNYIGQIPGQTYPFYKPYMDAGTGAIPILQQQYGGLLNDPTALINKISSGYQQSPYFKQRLAGTLSGAGRSAAARGYATAPRADLEGMDYANQLTGEDFNNYLKNALGQYGLGLGGEEKLFSGGRESGDDFAKMIAQALAQQGNLAFKEDEDQAASDNAIWGAIGKFLGSANI